MRVVSSTDATFVLDFVGADLSVTADFLETGKIIRQMSPTCAFALKTTIFTAFLD